MGFKENLKDELKYQGMLVKELSDKSGVPKGTIDHYLAEKHTAPIAENAVKIARALNVSVEYLVTGMDYISKGKHLTEKNPIPHKYVKLFNEFERLPEHEKSAIAKMISELNAHKYNEKS
ncbi:MAG: helix-turn-helix transcriptional regulator [Spirochaetaceae bacterium]|nr:helix-turn-helix transcriptional regulator [Spirochaetaceae bacterium]